MNFIDIIIYTILTAVFIYVFYQFTFNKKLQDRFEWNKEKRSKIPNKEIQKIKYDCVLDGKHLYICENYFYYVYVNDKDEYRFEFSFYTMIEPYWKKYANVKFIGFGNTKNMLILGDAVRSFSIHNITKKEGSEFLKELAKAYHDYMEKCVKDTLKK